MKKVFNLSRSLHKNWGPYNCKIQGGNLHAVWWSLRNLEWLEGNEMLSGKLLKSCIRFQTRGTKSFQGTLIYKNFDLIASSCTHISFSCFLLKVSCFHGLVDAKNTTIAKQRYSVIWPQKCFVFWLPRHSFYYVIFPLS